MYSLEIYNKKYEVIKTIKCKTVSEALAEIYSLPRNLAGAVIIAPDKRYPQGRRKVGEATPHPYRNVWQYSKWIDNYELTSHYFVKKDGSLRKLTKKEYLQTFKK